MKIKKKRPGIAHFLKGSFYLDYRLNLWWLRSTASKDLRSANVTALHANHIQFETMIVYKSCYTFLHEVAFTLGRNTPRKMVVF